MKDMVKIIFIKGINIVSADTGEDAVLSFKQYN